jgi:prepilin-type processing-associated H-X9-DG protein
MYSQDYDECFPAQGTVGEASTATIDSNYISENVGTPSWVGSLAPYMKSTKIFVCPTIGTGGKDIPVTYAANAYVLNTIASGLLKPTETVLILDCQQLNTGETYTKIAYDNTTNTGMSVHSDGANVGFIDGHVKWMKGSDAATKLVWKADGTL